MALVFKATGGVFIGGGIAPRFAGLMPESRFREAFDAKPPQEWFMRKIPTALITAEDMTLHGLAGVAAEPDRYLLDWPARLWSR
jgi:glucokinase